MLPPKGHFSLFGFRPLPFFRYSSSITFFNLLQPQQAFVRPLLPSCPSLSVDSVPNSCARAEWYRSVSKSTVEVLRQCFRACQFLEPRPLHELYRSGNKLQGSFYYKYAVSVSEYSGHISKSFRQLSLIHHQGSCHPFTSLAPLLLSLFNLS